MSETRFENEFEPRLREAVEQLAEQEREIVPPAYLRQRVMAEFVQHHAAPRPAHQVRHVDVSRPRRSPWSWLIPRPLIFAAVTCLGGAALTTIFLLARGDLLNQRSPAESTPHERAAAQIYPGEGASATPGNPEADELAQLAASYFAADQLDGTDAVTLYDDLHDVADFEYLIYIDVPTDQLTPGETFDPFDNAGMAEAGLAKIAVGDDGMVRAIQYPSRVLPD